MFAAAIYYNISHVYSEHTRRTFEYLVNVLSVNLSRLFPSKTHRHLTSFSENIFRRTNLRGDRWNDIMYPLPSLVTAGEMYIIPIGTHYQSVRN